MDVSVRVRPCLCVCVCVCVFIVVCVCVCVPCASYKNNVHVRRLSVELRLCCSPGCRFQ